MAIDWQWLPKGWLRTRQIRPAIHVHPGTGAELWFNHIAFWHSSSLEESVRARFEADFGVENRPYNTYYGDGAMIPDEIVQHLRGAYDEETVSFCWQSGALLMIANMLVAHGRSAFSGERRVLAALCDAVYLDTTSMAALTERSRCAPAARRTSAGRTCLTTPITATVR